jgi:hypothetical protein
MQIRGTEGDSVGGPGIGVLGGVEGCVEAPWLPPLHLRPTGSTGTYTCTYANGAFSDIPRWHLHWHLPTHVTLPPPI